MKKVFIILFTLFISINKIQAQEIINDYELTFNADIKPSYSVLIPCSVDIYQLETTIYYSVKGDIYADQVLHVEFDDSCLIQNGKAETLVYVEQNKKTYSYKELTNEYTTSPIKLSHNKLSSGRWNGELSIKIFLKEE